MAGACGAVGLALVAALALPPEPPELFFTIGPTMETPVGSSTMKVAPTLIDSDVPPSMTTPVVAQHESFHFDSLTSEAQGDGGYTVSFVMPPQRTVQDLPMPEDDRVTLRELQPRTVAALKFSGRSDGERVRRASEKHSAHPLFETLSQRCNPTQ